MWTGVTPGDGPQEVHVVLVDNGRTNALADPDGREALRCIRCSACLNICPVYERVGGHAYGSVYPGPIGSVITPLLRGTTSDIDQSLPFASSLCGACADVCPVRIPLPDLLVHLRNKVAEQKSLGRPHLEPMVMGTVGWAFSDRRHLETAERLAGVASKVVGKDYLGPMPWPAAGWTRARDLPMPPTESFRAWWRKNREGDQR